MTTAFHRIGTVLGLSVLLLFAGCNATGSARPGANARAGSAAPPPAAQAAIADATAAWPDAMRTRNASALASPFAEAGVLITADGKAVNGRAAIERYYREAFEHGPPILDGQLVNDGFALSGDFIHVWGHGTYTVERTPGQASTNGGHFLAVWQADATGAWRIVRYLTL